MVQEIQGGVVIAAVDGLGHGSEAAIAARIAIETMASHAHESVVSLLRRCHDGLLQTRGVVMSMAAINGLEDTITWLAVGNVEGILVRRDPLATPRYESILQRGGVVGYRLPPLSASVLSLMHGDLIIMTTDGIAEWFGREFRPNSHPQDLADRICNRYARASDDALVLVAKYLGGRHD